METCRGLGQACTGRLCLRPRLPPLSQAHAFPAAFWSGRFAADIGDSQTGRGLLALWLISQGEENQGIGGRSTAGLPPDRMSNKRQGETGSQISCFSSWPPPRGEKPYRSEVWTDSFPSWRPSVLAPVGKITAVRAVQQYRFANRGLRAMLALSPVILKTTCEEGAAVTFVGQSSGFHLPICMARIFWRILRTTPALTTWESMTQ